MQTFYDINFPLENNQAHLVESLTVICKGEAIFGQLAQFTNLKELHITLQKPLPTPQVIGTLAMLEFLTFQEQAVNFEIIAKLTNLKNLAFANIRSQEFAISADIKALANLAHLSVFHTYLTSLPPEIGELKALKTLSLHMNHRLQYLPTELCKLSNLTTLHLYGNALKEIEAGIFLLPHLQEVFLNNHDDLTALPETFADYTGKTEFQHTPIQIGWATDTPNLMQFVKELQNTITDLAKRRTFFNLYAGYHKRIKMPDCALFVQEAMTHTNKKLRLSAASYWYRNQPTPFPAQAKMTIHLTPTKDFIGQLTDVEDVLKAQNILLSARMNQEVTHLIVGKKPGNVLQKAQEKNVPIVSMGHLHTYLIELDEYVYLQKKDVETRLMAENMLNLLRNEDESNVELGLQMALGGGLHDIYFYDILLFYIWNNNNSRQKLAGKILEKYLPFDVFLWIEEAKCSKNDYASESDITKYLHKMSQNDIIDRDKLAISFYEKFKKGQEFCLKQAQSFIWYCQKKRKNSVLRLSELNLSLIPDTIGDLKGIKILYLQTNILKSLPASFSFLAQLDTLNLDHNLFELFPEILLKMPHLASLSIAHNKLKALPTQIHELRKLATLNLYNNDLTELPEGIFDLPALRRLEIGGTNPIKEQAKKIQERMPYCKVIADK